MDALLEALETEDPGLLVLAIEQAGSYLVVHVAERADVEVLATALLRHLEHPRAKVRQALAEIAIHLPDAAFETATTRLLQDANAFVKRAASKSYDERSRRARVVRQHEERSTEILDLRDRLRTIGKGALRLADQMSDRAVGHFADGLLHEILKVADPIRHAMVELRAEARAPSDRARLLARVDEAHARMELLLGIATSARAHAQAVDPKYRDLNLRALADEQLGLLRARIGDARDARLRVACDVDPNLSVEADRVLLSQALANLLQNAVEAHPKDGDGPIFVAIRAEKRAGGTLVAIAIDDRGGGIDPDLVALVGTPFRSSKGAGRGLGVLNVRRVVETLHGGSLEIHSELGVGTTMTVVIPRKQPVR